MLNNRFFKDLLQRYNTYLIYKNFGEKFEPIGRDWKKRGNYIGVSTNLILKVMLKL